MRLSSEAWHEAAGREQPTPAPTEPMDEWTPASKPQSKRILKRRYVQRGAAFRKAKDPRIKLRIGERVYVKNASGYKEIGSVTEDLALPKAYLDEEAA